MLLQIVMASSKDDGKVGVLFVCLGESLNSQLQHKQPPHPVQKRCTRHAGNICRSPAAEAVFKAKVEAAGLSDEFVIDSCGTGGGVRNWCVNLRSTIFSSPVCNPWNTALSLQNAAPCCRYKGGRSYHEGGPADARMIQAASKRSVDITSTSRPLKPSDLQKFDYIIGMDYNNAAAIQVAADYWAGEGHPVPSGYRDKVSVMIS